MFLSLSETLNQLKKLSSTTIKLVMFLVIFFGMYVGLIVTHEEFGLNMQDEKMPKMKVLILKVQGPEKLHNKACQTLRKVLMKSFKVPRKVLMESYKVLPEVSKNPKASGNDSSGPRSVNQVTSTARKGLVCSLGFRLNGV